MSAGTEVVWPLAVGPVLGPLRSPLRLDRGGTSPTCTGALKDPCTHSRSLLLILRESSHLSPLPSLSALVWWHALDSVTVPTTGVCVDIVLSIMSNRNGHLFGFPIPILSVRVWNLYCLGFGWRKWNVSKVWRVWFDWECDGTVCFSPLVSCSDDSITYFKRFSAYIEMKDFSIPVDSVIPLAVSFLPTVNGIIKGYLLLKVACSVTKQEVLLGCGC